MSPKVYPSDVSRELSRRFRQASADEWDADRCDVEAAGFLAELRQRGWSLNPDIDWRASRPVSPATPEVRAQALAEARAALHTQPSKPNPGGTE